MFESATTVIVILLVIVCVLILVVANFVITVKALKRDLNGLTKTLDKLDSRLDEQEQSLNEIRTTLANQGSDPIGSVIDAIKKWKTKGMIPALSLLGTQIFRSYLNKRKQKALPPNEDSE